MSNRLRPFFDNLKKLTVKLFSRLCVASKALGDFLPVHVLVQSNFDFEESYSHLKSFSQVSWAWKALTVQKCFFLFLEIQHEKAISISVVAIWEFCGNLLLLNKGIFVMN